jgi:hypothetical protein
VIEAWKASKLNRAGCCVGTEQSTFSLPLQHVAVQQRSSSRGMVLVQHATFGSSKVCGRNRPSFSVPVVTCMSSGMQRNVSVVTFPSANSVVFLPYCRNTQHTRQMQQQAFNLGDEASAGDLGCCQSATANHDTISPGVVSPQYVMIHQNFQSWPLIVHACEL